MTTKHHSPRLKPQDGEKRPKSLERELNPNVEAIRTRGTAARAPRTRPANELKDIVSALPSFTDDELRQIPVVQAGSRLTPGATYLDLRALRGREFSAPVEAYAGLDGWYVAKVDVAPPLWNRLLDGPRTLSAPEVRERRGSSPVRSVQAPARQHRARGH